MQGKTLMRYAALFAGALGFTAVVSSAVLAQSNYPSRPIRVLVGFAPGGPSDIVARVVGAKTGEIMGVQFVVENKTGAGGVVATLEAARAAPDGYTLLNSTLGTVANEFLSKTIKYEYGKDLIAVAPQAETANILVVSPSLGVKTVADLVKLAKDKPGVLQYATAGRGTATHLNSELFNTVAGIKTVAVHYRGGGDTVKDLLSGEVKMMFSSIAPVQGFVRDGRLIMHLGGYDDYQAALAGVPAGKATPGPETAARTAPEAARPPERSAPAAAAPAPTDGRARRRPRVDPAVRERRRRLDALETEIHAIEARLEDLGRTLADPALYADGERARAVTLERQQAEEQVAWLLHEWETLSESLAAHE